MKKEEYLRKLKYQLIDLPGEDLAQIEDFYEEFNQGMGDYFDKPVW